MKVAFASCICTQVFKKQSIWERILESKPDYFVFLGDSVYLDIGTEKHPSEMDDNEFSMLLHSRYFDFLKNPSIATFLRNFPPGRVFSTWDDHDFLWNDACGASLRESKIHRSKIDLSTGYHEVFRDVLVSSDLNLFPATHGGSSKFLAKYPKGLSTPSINISPGIWLHLLDVRSFRTQQWLVAEEKRTILGEAQRNKILNTVSANLNDIHLFASGSTFSSWKKYPIDVRWMMAIAEMTRAVLLSGDIHRNETDAHFWGRRALHEFTSSGAAVRDMVVIGTERQNFGILDFSSKTMSARLFSFGSPEDIHSRDISLNTWLPVT